MEGNFNYVEYKRCAHIIILGKQQRGELPELRSNGTKWLIDKYLLCLHQCVESHKTHKTQITTENKSSLREKFDNCVSTPNELIWQMTEEHMNTKQQEKNIGTVPDWEKINIKYNIKHNN